MEAWRDVGGFEDRYEVSDAGNVRSKSYVKQGRNKHGPFSFVTTPRLLRPLPIRTDYPTWYEQVKLYDGVGTSRMLLVHRLVAVAFLEPRSCEQTEVNHKNFLRNDNRKVNLEWVTPQENSDHARSLRKRCMPLGEDHHQGRLDCQTVRDIRLMWGEGVSLAQLGRDYGVSYQTISSVVAYKTWKEVA